MNIAFPGRIDKRREWSVTWKLASNEPNKAEPPPVFVQTHIRVQKSARWCSRVTREMDKRRGLRNSGCTCGADRGGRPMADCWSFTRPIRRRWSSGTSRCLRVGVANTRPWVRRPRLTKGITTGLGWVRGRSMGPTAARRRQWRSSRGCVAYSPNSIFCSNPRKALGNNNISKRYCSSWRIRGWRRGTRGAGGALDSRRNTPAQSPWSIRRRGSRWTVVIVLLGRTQHWWLFLRFCHEEKTQRDQKKSQKECRKQEMKTVPEKMEEPEQNQISTSCNRESFSLLLLTYWERLKWVLVNHRTCSLKS